MGVVCATAGRVLVNTELSLSGILAAFHTMICLSRLPAVQGNGTVVFEAPGCSRTSIRSAARDELVHTQQPIIGTLPLTRS